MADDRPMSIEPEKLNRVLVLESEFVIGLQRTMTT